MKKEGEEKVRRSRGRGRASNIEVKALTRETLQTLREKGMKVEDYIAELKAMDKRNKSNEMRMQKFLNRTVSSIEKKGYLNEYFVRRLVREFVKKGVVINGVSREPGAAAGHPGAGLEEGGGPGSEDPEPGDDIDRLALNEGSGSFFPKDALRYFLQDCRKYSLLTRGKERELARRIKGGDISAREDLINSNLLLVVKVAKGYLYRNVPLGDLIGYGIFGLITAVEKFNPFDGKGKDCKFSTYAINWIDQSISRSLMNEEHTGIRTPVHIDADCDQFLKARKILLDLEEEPDIETIAKYLKIDSAKAAKIHNILNTVKSIVSLDAVVNDKDDRSPIDFITNDSYSPEDMVIDDEYWQQIREKMRFLKEALNPEEWIVLERRFGLSSGEGKTLEEVGNEFDLSRERIRQIENRAIRKSRKILEKYSPAKIAQI